LEIQKRENDLACATFGYGFYILDDYTPLRSITSQTLAQEGAIFGLRKAYQFDEKGYVRAAFGNSTHPNPPFGAIITYYLKGAPSEPNSSYVLTIADSAGKEIRRINLPTPKDAVFNRINWDLREQAAAGGGGRRGRGTDAEAEGVESEEEEAMQSETEEVSQEQASGNDEAQSGGRRGGAAMRGGRGTGGAGARAGAGAGAARGGGAMRGGRGGGGPQVKPGKFTITLNKVSEGKTTPIGQPQTVEVIPLPR